MPGIEPDDSRRPFDLGRFYDDRRDELLAFCARVTERLPRIDHEDLLQGAWLKLLREHDQGRLDTSDPAKVVAWFKQVVRRSIIDELRTGYLTLESLHPDLGVVTSSDANRAVNPEQQWADRADLMRHILAMPVDLAEPFLYDDAGYSDKEIARILDITPDAVSQRLTRARAYLRRRLGVVAAAVPTGFLAQALRGFRRVAAKPAQAIATTVAYVSVVLAFSVPVAPVVRPVSAMHGPVVAHAQLVAGVPTAAAPHKGEMSRVGTAAQAAAGTAHHHVTAKPLPVPVPHIGGACAPHICVAATCDGDKVQESGDRLYLKDAGPCGPHSSQSAVPVCPYVVDNPVVGCQRDGDPQWVVGPPPPPQSTEGEPS